MLAIGSHLRHDGESFVVRAMEGTRLTLRSARGSMIQVDIGELLAHPTTRLLVTEPQAAEGAGSILSDLDAARLAQLQDRLAHVREAVCGFRSGNAATAMAGEPRPEYGPSKPIMDRYRAKATELGVDPSTVRRWAQQLRDGGPAALVDGRAERSHDPLRGVDQRWLDTCAAVLDEHVDASRPTRQLLLERVDARLGDDVPRPPAKRARRIVGELTRGTNAFTGSTKAKRSIANRPAGVYGRLRATRPGEYLLLDTTRLDVFAMEPLTLRWVGLELTIALDLYSRCIPAIRLTPVSTKAIDAGLVLYEAITPKSRNLTGSGITPYLGLPTTVVVDTDRLATGPNDAGLPGVAAETVVLDHGKIYLSEHLQSVCARLGISIQPARPYTPTDKAAVERFFRTLGEQLLAALPGYKGPDVYSRGADVESHAYFFIDELERIIREWIATVYHQRPHDGLVDPAVPGLRYSPAEMFEQGIARAGRLRIPARADLVYDFLPVVWRTIQHYGVEVHGLRYNGEALSDHRNRTSPYLGANAGKWPLRYDPDDVSRLFFQDPSNHSWHTLRWEHAQDVPAPFSSEALAYARQLAAQRDRVPDDRRALADLLDRWEVGLACNPRERRMALRLSQQRAARVEKPSETPGDEASAMAKVLALVPAPGEPQSGAGPLGGDDDADDELLAAAPDEREASDPDDGEFYADAMRTL
jgi:transposase InsO family protein